MLVWIVKYRCFFFLNCHAKILCEIWELHHLLYKGQWFYFHKTPSLFYHMSFKNSIRCVLKYSARNVAPVELPLILHVPLNLRGGHCKELLRDFSIHPLSGTTVWRFLARGFQCIDEMSIDFNYSTERLHNIITDENKSVPTSLKL